MPNAFLGPADEKHQIPRLGFGTYTLHGVPASEAVQDAIDLGYRHIDTARPYENEAYLGIGIRESGISRGDLFITSKISCRAFWTPSPRMASGDVRDVVRWAVDDSLMRLDTDYIDLLLLHWPEPDDSLEPTLKAMAELVDVGWIRHMGVSNFPAGMLERSCVIAPVFCNQVEYHPFLSQERLLATASDLGVAIMAHNPFAAGRVEADETLRGIGSRHGKTPNQVALRWLLEQENVGAVPVAPTYALRRENREIFDFKLTDDDRAAIQDLPKDIRTVDPLWAPDWSD